MVDIENNRKLKNDNKKLKDKKHKKITKDELNKKLKEKDDLIKKLEEKLSETEKLAQQKDNLSKEYLEHMKRLQADFENYKKREEKKRKDFIEFANKELLSKLLSVVDNLERALDSSKNESNVEAIKQGINNILKDFCNILNKEGVKPIKAKGHKFDPYKHEAVMTVETDQYPEDTITEELRKGYYFKSKVLRPAMVKVAVSSKKNK